MKPRLASAAERWRWLRLTHRNAASGSPRIDGSTSSIKNPRSKLRGIGGRKEADQKNAASCGEYVPKEIQGANPGDDEPDTGAQPTADHRGTDAIPRRVAWLLRVLPDSPGTHKSGGLDSPKATLIPLAAVGERAQPLQRTAPPWRIAVQSRGRCRFTDGFLAYVRTPSGPSSPYARWCGRGGAARRPPCIPING